MTKKRTAPNPKRQRAARETLSRLFADSTHTSIIHYSCESFYDRPEGRSPRITSIAIRRLDNGQTVSFSIHQIAEREHIPFADITERYDSLEFKMLGEYYDYIRCHQGTNYLHWNMRDVGYGFNAIDNRYKVLGGTPDVVVDERKFDLSRIFIEIYGVAYTGHPRLETILELNEIKALDFLSGKQEADAFDAKEYHSLHRSTLRKVDVLGNLASRSNDDQLSTKTSWWQLHGGHYRLVLEWLADNKLITLVMTVVGLILAVLTLK